MKTPTAALMGFALATGTLAAADAQSSPDILGVSIGMPADRAMQVASAAEKHNRIVVHREPLTQGPFTSKPLTFGASITNEDEKWGAVEMVQLLFSLKPGDGTLFITRREEYPDLHQDVAISTLVDTIGKKYGAPTYAYDTPLGRDLLWNFDGKASTSRTKQPDPASLAYTCAQFLQENSMSSFMTGYVGQLETTINETAHCGRWLRISIQPSSTNPLLAGEVIFVLGDFTKTAASYAYMNQMLAEGAATVGKAQSSKAASNKPRL